MTQRILAITVPFLYFLFSITSSKSLCINHVLFKGQYGFREKYSTQHAILDIVNTIQDNMDMKFFSCGVFLDLKKAFDTVDRYCLPHPREFD